MDNKKKNIIADELYFTGKLFLLGAIVSIILITFNTKDIGKSITTFFEDFGGVLIICSTFIGIGYFYRLFKWVMKWKSK